MVALNVVGRLRHQNDLNAYRRKLSDEIAQSLAIRLLPALLDVPLPLVGADGSRVTLDEALRSSPRIALAGPSGAGRRLALQQTARRWAAEQAHHQIPALAEPLIPALIALPRVDDGTSPPERLLAAALAPETRPQREGFALFRRAEAEEHPTPNLLLVHGWDELPDARRVAWRAALLDLATGDFRPRLVVTLPAAEPEWPSFARLAIAPVSPELLAAWVEHLVPAEHRAQFLSALAPGGALHPLSERLLDVALLAWLAPRAGLPSGRAALYDLALAEVLSVQPQQLSGSSELAALQLLAAYDERPTRVAADLLVVDASGGLRFAHPQLRRYLAARQLAAEGRFDLLRQVDPAERGELALLATTIVDDPTPIFAALWGEGRPDHDDLLAMGRCLRERAPRAPAWTLRVVAGLAQLARGSTRHERAAELLQGALTALDAALPLAASAPAGQQFLGRLFELLPDALAVPRMLGLALDPQMPEPFAWALADQLAARASTEPAQPPAEPPAQARWIYLQASAHVQIDPAAAAEALAALASSSAGDARQLRTATALLEDPAQATVTRMAALALLAGSSQPAALTVIERASGDASVEVRAAALAALSERDPERAAVALGRAALDAGAPWELRVSALQRLGDHLAYGASQLLERCALDAALPLYARMQAVAALGRHPEGAPDLHVLLNTPSAHREVRGAAARMLGALRYRAALPDLLRLIEPAATNPALVLGCCDGLGALGSVEATAALLRLIERARGDAEQTIAAVRALGRIGDVEAVEPLSRLLGGEALYRFQRGIEPRLIEQSVELCMHDPDVPRPIARRLAVALESSSTAEARPTTLIEFLTSEADRVRSAAAAALGAIGGNPARAALLAALLDDASAGATADVIATLGQVEGSTSAEALGYALEVHQQNPLTGWLIVRQLTDHPAGEEIMRRALARPDIDPFTSGALVEALGQRRALSALGEIRAIAEDRGRDLQLRSQAVLALGLLDDPAVEPFLVRLIGDEHEDIGLRGMAAEHLPQALSPDGRRMLRELLRNERPATPLVIGALRALGRARDHESLPLMLRYTQDETAAVAQAAIAALTELGDSSMAPMLVRITQSPSADHALRLQAIGALLQIGGSGYRPLLRVYLGQGALPFRLLALEYLIGGGAPAEELLALLANRAWPTALRLRLLDAFADDTTAAPALASILRDADDDLQIRGLAAEALGRMHRNTADLIGLAADQTTPVALRVRCLEAAHTIGGHDAWELISRLAENDAQPAAVREVALCSLREVADP